VFTGTAPNPNGRRVPLSFREIFLTRANLGVGYFLNGGLSGAVSFGPQ
jgi:hypothetical protein